MANSISKACWAWAKSGTRQWRRVQLAGRFGIIPESLRYRYWLVNRPHYAYGIHRAIDAASRLGFKEVTVIEFGVAGGNGLVALERHAEYLGKKQNIKVHVVGFDSGTGLPPSQDHRDQPYRWSGGFYGMDEAALRGRLHNAELVIGPVDDTLAKWIDEKLDQLQVAPVGFVSFDLDFWSSTIEAFELFRNSALVQTLPRVVCYFDDIVFSIDAIGELRAISDFNAESPEQRSIGQIFGLRPGIPFDPPWAEQFFEYHCFIHPLYSLTVEAAPVELPLEQ